MIRISASLRNVQGLIDKAKALPEMVAIQRKAAINDTVKGLRVDAGKMIREILQVTKNPRSNKTPKKIIESRIKLNFAAKPDSSGELRIKESEISLRWFGPKTSPPTKKGKNAKKKQVTSTKIFRGGSREIYKRGFGASTEKLGYTVWERQGSSRFPLKTHEGVSPAEIIRKRGGERRLKAQANMRLQKALVRRFKRLKYATGKRNQPK